MRVVAFGFLDRRPRFGGAEGNDLGILMRNHLPFREPGGVDFQTLLHNVLLEHHQPPLWYVGVPALFSPAETLSIGPLLLTNAAALALALWAAWLFGARQGSARLGLLAVVVVACLPGVAGRVTMLGIEPWHMALLGLSIGLLLRLREPDATRAEALLLGGVIAAGLLMKLTFVAGLFGPLLLDAVGALVGGRPARRWLRRLLEAGAVVVALLLVGYLPFASSLSDFFTMAQTEPTHSSVFTIHSVALLADWALLGLGPVGRALVALAVLGACLGRSWATPAPTLGVRPVTLLVASIVSLLFIHWLVPHKELRYLLPVAWSVGVLLAMGLGHLWGWSRLGRIVVIVALSLLALSTFVDPEDPQLPETAADQVPLELEPPMLRLWLDRSDYGLDDLVRHETFSELERSFVIITLDDPTYTTLRDMINWELYSRNDRPVVSLPKVKSLLDDVATSQLELATHVVTNRSLGRAELRVLEAFDFAEVVAVDLPLPGPKRWSLWARLPPKRVWDDFSKDDGDWELWSDALPNEPNSSLLEWTPDDQGHPGRAARLSGRGIPREGIDGPSARGFSMQRLFPKLASFHLSFDWRVQSDSASGVHAWLDLVDASDGTVLHRQRLTVGGFQDTGWLTLPPTDFTDVLADGADQDVFLRIGLRPEDPGPARHVLLVDNFELVRGGLEPPADVSLATDDPAAGVTPWTLWRRGSAGPTVEHSLALDGREGKATPAVHVVGAHDRGGPTPPHGIERRLPVTLPFVVSFDWLARGEAPDRPPSMTFELLRPDGSLAHSWLVGGEEAWGRYAPPDLSPNVLGLSEVIARVGVAETQGSGARSELWVDGFSWTAPCDSPRSYFVDRDGDGHGDARSPHPYGEMCHGLPGWVADSSDCDDEDDDSHPGAAELCDGRDNDCVPSRTAVGEVDLDGDGQLVCEGDCDDNDPATYRGAIELCDGRDNNCDGLIEDSSTDSDGDGKPLCDGDCDDSDPDIWPRAPETCHDGLDQDCDGGEARDGFDPECGPPPVRQ
ncbi:MAG: hypothetical protein GY898_32035 [Proteobacteria bacterium]|nr:hypothetical protein [Pseudomonadota bacterium]